MRNQPRDNVSFAAGGKPDEDAHRALHAGHYQVMGPGSGHDIPDLKGGNGILRD